MIHAIAYVSTIVARRVDWLTSRVPAGTEYWFGFGSRRALLQISGWQTCAHLSTCMAIDLQKSINQDASKTFQKQSWASSPPLVESEFFVSTEPLHP